MHNAIKWCLVSGVAPETRIPLYPTVQQKSFWMPRMVVFEMHNAKKKGVWLLGWRPKHPYQCSLQSNKGVVGYLGRGVFEMHNAIKWCLASGGAPQRRILLYLTVQQKCFWIPGMVMKCTVPENGVWVLGWRPKHPYLCRLQSRKGAFGCLG